MRRLTLVITALLLALVGMPFADAQQDLVDIAVAPPSIDGTGTTDATADLQAFFQSVPNGTEIRFPPQSRYRIEGTLIFSARRDLVIDGAGAEFFATTDGANAKSGSRHPWWGRNWPRKRGQFVFDGGRRIELRNMTIRGGNPKGGTRTDAYVEALEAQHAIEFFGTTDASVLDCTISHTYGDLINISGDAARIRVQGCVLERSGRQGVTASKATDVKIVNNDIREIRRSAIDLEPVRNDWTVNRIAIERNRFGPVRLTFVAALGTGDVSHVLVARNSLGPLSLEIQVKDTDGGRRSHWEVRDNTASIYGSPVAPMKFTKVDHLRVTGNDQPLNSRRSGLAVASTGGRDLRVVNNDFRLTTERDGDVGIDGKVLLDGDRHPQPLVVRSEDANAQTPDPPRNPVAPRLGAKDVVDPVTDVLRPTTDDLDIGDDVLSDLPEVDAFQPPAQLPATQVTDANTPLIIEHTEDRRPDSGSASGSGSSTAGNGSPSNVEFGELYVDPNSPEAAEQADPAAAPAVEQPRPQAPNSPVVEQADPAPAASPEAVVPTEPVADPAAPTQPVDSDEVATPAIDGVATTTDAIPVGLAALAALLIMLGAFGSIAALGREQTGAAIGG